MTARKINPKQTWLDRGGRHGIENRMSDFISELDLIAPLKLNALDIGAAEGQISEQLALYFEKVVAIEPSTELFKQLQTRAKNNPKISCSPRDIMTWDLDRKTDVSFFLGVLHYFEGDQKHREVLDRVLALSRCGCIMRCAIREYRIRDKRHLNKRGDDLSNRYLALELLKTYAAKFDIFILDNGYRGIGDRRLGDLVVFRRKTQNNPLPMLDKWFSQYMDSELSYFLST